MAGKGCFGASLMLEPQLVADCCAAMAAATHVPITVKCRLGARRQLPASELLEEAFHGGKPCIHCFGTWVLWSANQR